MKMQRFLVSTSPAYSAYLRIVFKSDRGARALETPRSRGTSPKNMVHSGTSDENVLYMTEAKILVLADTMQPSSWGTISLEGRPGCARIPLPRPVHERPIGTIGRLSNTDSLCSRISAHQRPRVVSPSSLRAETLLLWVVGCDVR